MFRSPAISMGRRIWVKTLDFLLAAQSTKRRSLRRISCETRSTSREESLKLS